MSSLSTYVIEPAFKNYSWAERDPAKNMCRAFLKDEQLPIAELWYGTHSDGEAYIRDTGEPLGYFLGSDMNHLFKILSVGAPLSIQIHPDRYHAERLHANRPDLYPDPNPKPEMAILLSDKGFAFCGIRPIRSIQHELLTYFSDIFDRHVLNRWSRCDSATDECTISSLVKDTFINLLEMSSGRYDLLHNRLYRKYQVFRWLEQFHPNDRGCSVCVLFLQYFAMQKYDAICVQPNVIHAYVLGSFFECMTTSNNVIRLGMTTKDVDFTSFFSIARFVPSPTLDMIEDHGSHRLIREYGFLQLPIIRIIDSTAYREPIVVDITSFMVRRYMMVFVVEGGGIDGYQQDGKVAMVVDWYNELQSSNPNPGMKVAPGSVMIVISI